MITEKNIVVNSVPEIADLLELINCSTNSKKLISNLDCEIKRNQKTKTLLKFTLNNSVYFLKVWWDKNFIRILKNYYRGDLRAYREAKGLLLLGDVEFKTPQLIAYGFSKQNWIKKHSFILTKQINNSFTLNYYLSKYFEKKIIRKLAFKTFSMHKDDIVHGDFHHENVLLANDNDNIDFFILDWMSVRRTDKLISKLYDISNFIFYAKLCSWVKREEIINLFLNTYLSFYPNNEVDNIRKIIFKKIHQKKKWEELYRKIQNLG